MSPCNPSDVSVNIPTGPSGPAIPGFGIPFALKVDNSNPFPGGFPENLLELFEKLQCLIPSGSLKPSLSPNFSKDPFDAILSLLDKFMPYIMLYKFFLPVLEIIICIIEVLCSLMNPFKLIRSLNRLFSKCIPAFLNIFPVFAIIVMLISLCLLILAFIEYIAAQILKLIKAILKNIRALEKAFVDGDGDVVLAITKKLGSLLCIFQNLFVLFSIFNVFIDIIKNIVALTFSIPPCEDGDPSDQNGCCTPDVCPSIVKQPYTRITGTFKYLPKVGVLTSIPLPVSFGGAFNYDVRPETWQFFDDNQLTEEKFRNIFDAWDVTLLPKPIFFPTDGTYDKNTDSRQAPYTVDLRLFYNPSSFGRQGQARFIRFNNCIVTSVPGINTIEGNLTSKVHDNGVLTLAGGVGYEDDNLTKLNGFADDGITLIPSSVATIENFIHLKAQNSQDPILTVNDGYSFLNVEYTFKPNIAPLLTKNIVTIGCVPSIAMNRAFVNGVFAGDAAIKASLLNNLLKDPNFPNPSATQECLSTAIAGLRADMTPRGVANFNAIADACLKKLKDDTNSALGPLIGIGFDPCNSVVTLDLNQQFTTLPIKVLVSINERHGNPLMAGISNEVAADIGARIKGYPTFGSISNFTYDGNQLFVANLTSKESGNGKLTVSFDNEILCTNTLGEPNDDPLSTENGPKHTLQEVSYSFVYAPVGGFGSGGAKTGKGDTEGQPRRDIND